MANKGWQCSLREQTPALLNPNGSDFEGHGTGNAFSLVATDLGSVCKRQSCSKVWDPTVIIFTMWCADYFSTNARNKISHRSVLPQGLEQPPPAGVTVIQRSNYPNYYCISEQFCNSAASAYSSLFFFSFSLRQKTFPTRPLSKATESCQTIFQASLTLVGIYHVVPVGLPAD